VPKSIFDPPKRSTQSVMLFDVCVGPINILWTTEILFFLLFSSFHFLVFCLIIIVEVLRNKAGLRDEVAELAHPLRL